jgi:hypothetical protein
MSTAPAAALVRLRRPVAVLVNLPPTETLPGEIITSDLISAMMVDRAVHHFRVQDPDGTVWFVWPSWIMGEVPSLAAASMAEVPL